MIPIIKEKLNKLRSSAPMGFKSLGLIHDYAISHAFCWGGLWRNICFSSLSTKNFLHKGLVLYSRHPLITARHLLIADLSEKSIFLRDIPGGSKINPLICKTVLQSILLNGKKEVLSLRASARASFSIKVFSSVLSFCDKLKVFDKT